MFLFLEAFLCDTKSIICLLQAVVKDTRIMIYTVAFFEIIHEIRPTWIQTSPTRLEIQLSGRLQVKVTAPGKTDGEISFLVCVE